MIFGALGVWYIIVASAPGYISEYLPPESPANATNILGDFIVAIIWLAIMYFTWKQKRPAFLASIAYTLFPSVSVSVDFLYTKSFVSAPAYSDFIWYPDSVLVIIFSIMAYRSLRRAV